MIGECEMTGRRNVPLFQIKIEGTTMNVCQECVKFGEKITKPSSFKTAGRMTSFRNDRTENEFIVKDYAMRIKSARESKKLKQSEVADKLNEKESLIHNIESGHMKPNFPLAKKIARFFNIALIETIKPIKSVSSEKAPPAGELTMEAKLLAAMKKVKKK